VIIPDLTPSPTKEGELTRDAEKSATKGKNDDVKNMRVAVLSVPATSKTKMDYSRDFLQLDDATSLPQRTEGAQVDDGVTYAEHGIIR
jgi:hypothetical protein